MLIRATTMGEALYAAALRAPANCRTIALRIIGGSERAIVKEFDTVEAVRRHVARTEQKVAPKESE